jgi:hypothetical protein
MENNRELSKRESRKGREEKKGRRDGLYIVSFQRYRRERERYNAKLEWFLFYFTVPPR